MTSLFDDLTWRGLIQQSTGSGDALRAVLDGPPITFYVGFDPTAPSLHIGNLVQLLTARRIQHGGHCPLGLVGGSTGLIGDPRMSGERVLNSPEVVAGWVEKIRVQVEKYLDFEGANAARIVNNLDWTAPMSAIEFLRDVGKHFRMGRMLAKETVAARLNSDDGLSFTEFSYQILQGMDYLELFRRYGCTLQTGGSDQWGNLISGTELIHKVEGAEAHALATPLITKADGTKFGKTEGGTVWLDGSMTSPWTFYQFWINADDRDVVGYLKVFSFRSRSEIEVLATAIAERPYAREAQRALAADVTTLVHGEAATASAIAASTALFGRGELGRDRRTHVGRRPHRGRRHRGRPAHRRGRPVHRQHAGRPPGRRRGEPLPTAASTSTTSGSPTPGTSRRAATCCTAVGWYCVAESARSPGSVSLGSRGCIGYRADRVSRSRRLRC